MCSNFLNIHDVWGNHGYSWLRNDLGIFGCPAGVKELEIIAELEQHWEICWKIRINKNEQ